MNRKLLLSVRFLDETQYINGARTRSRVLMIRFDLALREGTVPAPPAGTGHFRTEQIMEIEETIEALKYEVKVMEALILALEDLRRRPAGGRHLPQLFLGATSSTDSAKETKRPKVPRKTKQSRQH